VLLFKNEDLKEDIPSSTLCNAKTTNSRG